MFETIISEFKNVWRKPNNSVMQIIVINTIVFLVINIIDFGLSIFKVRQYYETYITSSLYIPSSIFDFLWRPWTLFTHFFTHKNLLHLFYNMWMVYWFGLIIKDFLGSVRLTALYIWGGVAGGLLYLLLTNTVPFYTDMASKLGMLGASACMFAVVTAAAAHRPNLEMNLLFFGNVRIVWVALIVMFLSFIGIGSTSSDLGMNGNVTHLAGALVGYIFIKQLEAGNDWSKPISALIRWFTSIFGKKNGRSSSTKSKTSSSSKTSKSKGTTTATSPSQDEIDAILDKISANGYESLTTEEKQILFKASQKK
jgi:membrane associated rhomboid family serine protease